MKKALILGGALIVAGCSTMNAAPASGGAGTAKVTGTVAYLQRIALPPTAVVKVQLIDVSLADAPSVTLGEQVIESQGRQVPFAFSIAYDPAKIEERKSYAVSARIEDAGKLLFISDTRYSVITRGAPTNVEMVLRPVGGPASR